MELGSIETAAGRTWRSAAHQCRRASGGGKGGGWGAGGGDRRGGRGQGRGRGCARPRRWRRRSVLHNPDVIEKEHHALLTGELYHHVTRTAHGEFVGDEGLETIAHRE